MGRDWKRRGWLLKGFFFGFEANLDLVGGLLIREIMTMRRICDQGVESGSKWVRKGQTKGRDWRFGEGMNVGG